MKQINKNIGKFVKVYYLKTIKSKYLVTLTKEEMRGYIKY
jgi:hypothetical protein